MVTPLRAFLLTKMRGFCIRTHRLVIGTGHRLFCRDGRPLSAKVCTPLRHSERSEESMISSARRSFGCAQDDGGRKAGAYIRRLGIGTGHRLFCRDGRPLFAKVRTPLRHSERSEESMVFSARRSFGYAQDDGGRRIGACGIPFEERFAKNPSVSPAAIHLPLQGRLGLSKNRTWLPCVRSLSSNRPR